MTARGVPGALMHILQQPLFEFNQFCSLNASDRLTLVLETLDAERLLGTLRGESPLGLNGCPPRVLWAALLAGVVHGSE